MSIQKHATNYVYFLDDGTGMLEAQYGHADAKNEEAQYWKDVDELFEDDDEQIRSVAIVNHLIRFIDLSSLYTHARVIGDFRRIGAWKYINATHIRPIVDPHEINLHLLEAVAWHFSIGRPAVNNSFRMTSTKAH